MKTLQGEPLSDKDLKLLAAGESATFALRPLRAHAAGQDYTLPMLLLTDRRMVLSKDRMFGGLKEDFGVSWADVESVSGGPGVTVQSIRLVVSLVRGEVALDVSPEFAVEVESAIQARLQ